MILVVGATGNLGGAVTRMLLAQGQPVRILARPQSDYQPLADAGAQVMLGDLKQRSSLTAACEGADTIITTANSAARGGEDNVQTVDLEGNRNLIDEACTVGVNQFIFVSVLTADANSPVPFIQAKGKTEEYLRASGIPYTIFAPNGYMEVMVAGVVGMPAMMGQPVTIVGGGRRKHSFISVGDVAAFILAVISNPAAINQKLLLGGPQPLSFRDAIAIYERVLGHQIQVRSVAPGEPVPGLPQTVAHLLAALDTYDSPIEMTETARTFGIQLTPLEEVARRTVSSAASA
jgi:NADH dehydrogenase